MNIKCKLDKGAIQPTYATDGSAGLDLYVPNNKDFCEYENYTFLINTGVHLEIPKNHVGLVFVRSGLGFNGVTLMNGVGVIDSDYCGSIKLKFVRNGEEFLYFYEEEHEIEMFSAGMRVAQIVIVPYKRTKLEIVDELSDSKRGTGGIGSTGS